MIPPVAIGSASWLGTPVAPARIGQYPLPAEAPLLNLASPGPASDSTFLCRDELADCLVAYNAGVGNPLTDATAAAIRSDGVFIIAGQQPGLLLGPMFTILKAATAMLLAERLAPRTGVPVIPAFWVASEDHDVEEVNHCTVNRRLISLPHRGAIHAPVGQISLEACKAQILADFTQAVAGTPYATWVMELVASTRFENYADAFAQLLAKLFPGRLVLIDPLHLRSLTAPVMLHLMSRWQDLTAALQQGGKVLRRWGFTPPLDKITVFRIIGGHRVPIDPADVADPQQLSPSAALRPIVQDAILPTLATIGGPTEMCYLWQVDPLYPVAGVRRSRLHARLSATFVDGSMINRAARFGLTGEQLLDVQRELQRYDARLKSDEIDPDLRDIQKVGDDLLERVRIASGGAQHKPLTKGQKSIAFQVGKMIGRLREQRAEQAGAGRRNMEKLVEVIFPGGKLQERVISPFDLLTRFGPSWLERVLQNTDPEIETHWLVQLQDPPR